MRTIKKLINTEKKVYILLKNKAIQYRFMSDAEREERLRFSYKKCRTRYNNSSRFRETGAGVARVSRINPRHRAQAPCSRTECRRCRNTY